MKASNTTAVGLAKVDIPKRDVFFSYDWIRKVADFHTYCDTTILNKGRLVLQSYKAVAANLLLRRDEVSGTAIASLETKTLQHCSAVIFPIASLGTALRKTGHADVILYLGFGDSDKDTVPPETIGDYLSYLNLPG